jgi:triosephosphate isomerase (TIM)
MKTIVGNWKMNVGTRESVALARGILLALRGKKALPTVIACPPYTAIAEVRKVVARSHVLLGAQDVFWEEVGAFTGEVSVRMLGEHGVTHVIVGHSERRRVLGETDEMVGKKLACALGAGLVPILCVGEDKKERAEGKAEDVVGRQLTAALGSLTPKGRAKLMIAYEPVWAIGTGEAATPADAVAMHAFIRAQAGKLLPSLASSTQVLYGGSVDGSNAYAFLREKEVDGVLVGGASVKLKEFSDILAAASEVIEAQGDSV